MNTTVCDGNTVNMPCGYINNYYNVTPYWKIIKRDSSGSVISLKNIFAFDIFNKHDGLMWIRDRNNLENNRLVVGPVNETYNWTSYQCVILTSPAVYSSVGTLTVAGEIFYYVRMYLCVYCLIDRLIT